MVVDWVRAILWAIRFESMFQRRHFSLENVVSVWGQARSNGERVTKNRLASRLERILSIFPTSIKILTLMSLRQVWRDLASKRCLSWWPFGLSKYSIESRIRTQSGADRNVHDVLTSSLVILISGHSWPTIPFGAICYWISSLAATWVLDASRHFHWLAISESTEISKHLLTSTKFIKFLFEKSKWTFDNEMIKWIVDWANIWFLKWATKRLITIRIMCRHCSHNRMGRRIDTIWIFSIFHSWQWFYSVQLMQMTLVLIFSRAAHSCDRID